MRIVYVDVEFDDMRVTKLVVDSEKTEVRKRLFRFKITAHGGL